MLFFAFFCVYLHALKKERNLGIAVFQAFPRFPNLVRERRLELHNKSPFPTDRSISDNLLTTPLILIGYKTIQLTASKRMQIQ